LKRGKALIEEPDGIERHFFFDAVHVLMKAEGIEMRLADDAFCLVTGGTDAAERNRDSDADNDQDDQQFDEREGQACGAANKIFGRVQHHDEGPLTLRTRRKLLYTVTKKR